MKHKLPTEINGLQVKQEGHPFTIDNGKLKGEKFISLVPIDEDNHSRWEFQISTGRAIHTIDENGDIIYR